MKNNLYVFIHINHNEQIYSLKNCFSYFDSNLYILYLAHSCKIKCFKIRVSITFMTRLKTFPVSQAHTVLFLQICFKGYIFCFLGYLVGGQLFEQFARQTNLKKKRSVRLLKFFYQLPDLRFVYSCMTAIEADLNSGSH